MMKPRTEDELSKFVSISAIEPPSLDLYVTLNSNDNIQYCRLCNIEFKSEESHSSSRQHEARAQEVSDRATTIIQIHDEARLLPSLVKQSLSPYAPWQGKIYELIGRAFMEEDRTLVKDANRLLLKYQQLECISLLELAVWKFTCVTVNPHDDDAEGPRTYLEWKQWDANGWKAYKKQQFRCNQVVILMNVIVPFLFGEEIRSDLLQPLVMVEVRNKDSYCNEDVSSSISNIDSRV